MASRVAELVIIVVAGVVSRAEPTTLDLGGQWTAKETTNTYEFSATVPGGVYTDLMNIKLLDDVFYGYNDERFKWVGQINWTYHRTFEVDELILSHDNVNLVFEGIDTFAEIVVNNVTVGTTENMFVKYVFDVKRVLKTGKNSIYIYFQSPVEKGRILNDIQLQKYRIPWECPADEYRGECHINMLRKMQASFSWDWGPSFASMGIWKPVYIEAYKSTVIDYIVSEVIDKNDSHFTVTVDVYFADNNVGVVNGKVKVLVDTDKGLLTVGTNIDLEANAYGEFVVQLSISVPKKDVGLWWPNGYGDAKLYNLTVRYDSSDNTETSIKTVRIGFRTVELVQNEISSGLTFFFKVNGIPIFMKGSNEIPINILPELGQNETTIRSLLQSAKDVHMNMLRVWGGGVYESDIFYDVADEMGIMIWQDFMFACSLYPVYDEYLSNVVKEVRHNVKRIYSHPSIIVYSGNNENEGVLANNWYGTQDNYTLYKKDYVKLYITTIETEFDRLTHDKGIYVSSSPSNGKESATEGYVAANPGSSLYGDVHFYNYAMDPWNSNYYPIPRFCSEYGYQSLPSIDSWMTATNDSRNLTIGSEFLNHRQHHPGGNDELKLLIDMNLPLPSVNSSHYDLAFFFYSQIYAAQSIKVETEHYRRYRSILDDQGQGYTMGALYWQLNDVWVAPTWSSIDYTGRWKMLHYFARNFFAPVIVTGHINTQNQLQIYTVSDELVPHNVTTVVVKVYSYNDTTFKPVAVKNITTNVLSSFSHLETTIAIEDFLANQTNHKCGTAPEVTFRCFFYLQLTNSSGARIAPDNYVFPAPFTVLGLPVHTVSVVEVVATSHWNTFRIQLTAEHIALFVWLDSHKIRGRFSENGFLMVEETKTVYFHSEDPTVNATLIFRALTVTHLRDRIYFHG